MKTIYKYPIRITDDQEVEMLTGATPCHVGLDPQGQPCVWAAVDNTAPPEPVGVIVVGTGNPVPDVPCRYLGSFLQGPFVWYVLIKQPEAG